MNIGIDIDNTISYSDDIYTEYAIKYNKIKNIEYDIKEKERYGYTSFGWTKENKLEFDRMFLANILSEAKVIDNAPHVINELKNMGHNIYIITARNEYVTKNIYGFTKKWLDKNLIYFDKLIVNALDKSIKCLENNIGVFIDDNIRNCNNVYCATDTYVMLYTNKSNSKYYPPYKRVYNWQEIYNEILNLNEENILRLK